MTIIHYLLQCGGETDTVAGVRHLVDQAHVLLHGIDHVGQRVLLHCKTKDKNSNE